MNIRAILTAATLLIATAAGAQDRQQRLKDHVYYLADDSMRGRKAGSDDAAKAREYIIREYQSAGIRPFFGAWEAPFEMTGKTYVNVVGVIEGSDPALRDEYIVIGAHYDHLGVKGDGRVYNGADDNASGSAAVIELARGLQACRESLGRSVILAAFDAEEIGLYGSTVLLNTLKDTIQVSSIKLMMSLDMVGWYRQSGHLVLEGVATIRDGKGLAEREAARADIDIKAKKFETSILTATDTQAYAKAGIPTLAVSTGLKSPYHKPEDDADLIDYEGLDKVTGYIEGLTIAAASDPKFDKSGKVAPKHSNGHKKVEAGMSLSYTDAAISFTKGGMDTRNRQSVTAGTFVQYNTDGMGYKAGVEFQRLQTTMPDVADLFGSSKKYLQNAITVPVTIMMQASDGMFGGYWGVGAYYSHVLSSSCTAALPGEVVADQFGWLVAVGFRIGHVSLNLEGRTGLGSMIKGANTRLGCTMIGIGYSF